MNTKIHFLFPSIIFFVICSVFVNPSLADAKPLNIALVLWRGETDAEKGFKDGLKELGYSVEYKAFNGDLDKSKLIDMIRKKIKYENFDYIYSFGTTVSIKVKSWIKQNNLKVPQIFNIPVNPVKTGIAKSMKGSGGNLGGTSGGISVRLQIINAQKIYKFKKLAFLFNPREKQSIVIKKQLFEAGKELGFEVISLRSPPVHKTLDKNLSKLVNKAVDADAIYLPADTFLISQAPLISEKLINTKLLSIGGHKIFVKEGIATGTLPSYYKLGKLAANVLDKHQKGEKLEDIPVYADENPQLVINTTTVRKLGLNIAPEILKDSILFK